MEVAFSSPSLFSSNPPPMLSSCASTLLPRTTKSSSSSSSTLLRLPSLRRRNSVITNVIPFVRGNARSQPPPDLASYLFHNRIVYLAMPLVSSVTELIVAEFMLLQMLDDAKPIYFYINSTGTTKGGQKFAYETEAFAVYDLMRFLRPPIFTLCVGNAWGECALLLAAGAKGNRAALPSSTIMIKEPIDMSQGQASALGRKGREMIETKKTLVELFARETGKSTEQIEKDMKRVKYFNPSEAVEYGIIDKVLYTEKAKEDRGALQYSKSAKPT